METKANYVAVGAFVLIGMLGPRHRAALAGGRAISRGICLLPDLFLRFRHRLGQGNDGSLQRHRCRPREPARFRSRRSQTRHRDDADGAVIAHPQRFAGVDCERRPDGRLLRRNRRRLEKCAGAGARSRRRSAGHPVQAFDAAGDRAERAATDGEAQSCRGPAERRAERQQPQGLRRHAAASQQPDGRARQATAPTSIMRCLNISLGVGHS